MNGPVLGELLVFKQMHSRIGADVLGQTKGNKGRLLNIGKCIVSSSNDIKDVSKNCSVMFLGSSGSLHNLCA